MSKPKSATRGPKGKGRGAEPDVKNRKAAAERTRPSATRELSAKTEDRRPKTEDRRPRTEDRGPKSDNLIFGVLPVLEALRAGARRVEKIMIAEGARERRIAEILELARAERVPFQRVARETLAKQLAPGANHQGVAAQTAAADYADADELLDAVAGRADALALVLDGVEDPRNLGAILRVAECAGVDGTFIPEHRAVGLTETVVKTSAGATEYASIAKVKNLNRLIEQLKSNNIWVVGTSGEAAINYTDWDWTRKCALVLGSEGRGLHRLVAENCDALVRIPMQGKIESLNVSVAAGVILFEAVRQRAAAEQASGEETEAD